MHTDPDLTPLLVELLTAELDDAAPTLFHLPENCQRLATQQHTIGTKQLLLGRFHRSWAHIQDAYLTSQKLRTKSLMGSIWTTRVIAYLWKLCQDVWTARNEVVHGHNRKTRASRLRNRIRRELLAVHKLRPHVLAQDKDKFLVASEYQLDDFISRRTNVFLQDWLAVNRPYLEASARCADELAVSNTRQLSHYWPIIQASIGRTAVSLSTKRRSHKPESRLRTRHDRERARKRLAVGSYRLTSFFSLSTSTSTSTTTATLSTTADVPPVR